MNQGKFIERAIRSVLDQGYENLEYVIVDGGSSDETVEVIRRYEDRLSSWISEPDEGQTDAINKGLRRVSGDIVAYMNSDDYYLPGAFDAAMAALEAHPEAQWAVGAARFVDADGGYMETWHAQPPGRHRHLWMLLPWSAPQPSSFWRRGVFEQLGPFRRDMHYVFDTEFALRLVYAGHAPVIVPDELAVRVVHPEAKSWDRAPFELEQQRFVELFGPSLTPFERARMRLTRTAMRAGVPRLTATASRAWRRAAGRPEKAWTAAK
jgi:glycosyltransferase involved in cell wall biosynthesis